MEIFQELKYGIVALVLVYGDHKITNNPMVDSVVQQRAPEELLEEVEPFRIKS